MLNVIKNTTTVKLGVVNILMITGISYSQPCISQELPLWEFGIGISALHLPFYRGANSTKNFYIPFPYLRYRGNNFNVDEDGVHQKLFKSDNLKLELSLAGGVPVPSGDTNGARDGMPDLAPTVEFGPALEMRLWRNEIYTRSLLLSLPLRAAFSVSSSGIDHQGYTFSPYIQYELLSGEPDYWKVGLAFGPIYADAEYNNYYYEVEPQYATISRPEYHSKGGYSGSRITLTLQKNIADIWLGAFLRYDNLEKAVFDDSPLVKSHHYKAVGIAMSWVFAKSKTMVKVN